jgi:hypothetical protein
MILSSLLNVDLRFNPYCPAGFSKKTSAIVAVVMLLATFGFAQTQTEEGKAQVDALWNEGSIMTSDGKELIGLIRYNDKTGLLSFESGATSRSFTARSVVAFEFFDELVKKQRLFYSLPVKDENGIERPFFLEAIMEFKSFAVLSKIDPINIDHRAAGGPSGYTPATGYYGQPQSYGTIVTVSQVETIYLMDANSNIKPYVRITESEIDGVLYDRTKTKNKMLDDELLEQFVGKETNSKLIAYAKKNDLSFKEKKDLMKIFEHYREIAK